MPRRSVDFSGGFRISGGCPAYSAATAPGGCAARRTRGKQGMFVVLGIVGFVAILVSPMLFRPDRVRD
ncbi:hypothetical protein ACE7GA_08115 [Roseomonas sp. CCTCC AB2023176]|uniref:hypothetical protein n=1 Tax=Roseomonas sp. CCTCC AB2023176 TaxID=3342640 RepID=UPI0035DA8654